MNKQISLTGYLEPKYPVGDKNGPFVRYSDYQTEVDYLRSIIIGLQEQLTICEGKLNCE